MYLCSDWNLFLFHQVFDSSGLDDANHALYLWLDSLLHSSLPEVQNLAHETVRKLLEQNPDVSSLLDWTIDRCYTQVVNLQGNNTKERKSF